MFAVDLRTAVSLRAEVFSLGDIVDDLVRVQTCGICRCSFGSRDVESLL
jgi:hypothetical protein